MKILFWAIFAVNFLSPKMMFCGIYRGILNFQNATLLGKQSPLKHAVWCKNDGDTPKNVFSRAWQVICNKKVNNNKKPLNMTFHLCAGATLLGRLLRC